MEIYYANSENKRIVLDEWPIAIEDITPLFAKAWDYELTELKTVNKSNIKQFYRTSKLTELMIQIFADSEEEYEEIMNNFEEITEYDVLNETPGKLWCNGYYMSCFIAEDKTLDYEENFYTIDRTVRVLSVNPFWIREKTAVYKRSDRPSNGYLNYPYNYPYNYAPNKTSVFIENIEVMPCDLKMVIQGPCTNPEVMIGENKYQVMTELNSYEYIVLNTAERTVYKVSQSGVASNIFGSLNRGYDNFAKLPHGKHAILTNGTFPVQITEYMARSEPRWKS